MNEKWLYFSGLVAADGHIECDNCVTISQKRKDFIDKLVEISKESAIHISSVFYDKSAGVWKIKIRDRNFFEYLLNNGLMCGKKSELIKPPSITYNEGLPYVVGFIDGDGWVEQIIKKHKDKEYRYLRIGLKTKSKSIRDWMLKVLDANGIKGNKADKKDGYEIHIDTKEAWKLSKFLLNPTHLERLTYIVDVRISRQKV